jgi:Fur family ferric uptake transcriptional regulator
MYINRMKKTCCAHALTPRDAHELLALHGLNRTEIKTQILVQLSKSKKPLSASELHQKLGADSCNISSVFRSLTQFQEIGLVRELNLGEDFFRFELVNLEDSHHHHHHVRCRDCGDIKLIENCDLSNFEKMIAKMGFKQTEHTLEFTGVCGKCN